MKGVGGEGDRTAYVDRYQFQMRHGKGKFVCASLDRALDHDSTGLIDNTSYHWAARQHEVLSVSESDLLTFCNQPQPLPGLLAMCQ